MHKQGRVRLDDLLMDRRHFADVRSAQAHVMAGKVLVDGAVCDKPGTRVKSIRRPQLRYVSRGGYKLEAALRSFAFSVVDKIVLDAGAASGGFTDCLLQHGAKLVYALDAGYGQLKGRLAANPRVINWERTNISDVGVEDFVPALDLCVVDLSYLSLVKAVPILKSLFRGPYQMICLVKPLYEGLDQKLKADPRAIRCVLEKVLTELSHRGTHVANVIVSPIFGSRDSVEFLILLKPGGKNLNVGVLANSALQDLENQLQSIRVRSAIPRSKV
jgi:23S rRNA (cytidine1920-2'-O)/16S rRNA (cytidine1409-2'-O)-methyltransferase